MKNSEKNYNKIIYILSIIIPVAVSLLFTIKLKDFGIDMDGTAEVEFTIEAYQIKK